MTNSLRTEFGLRMRCALFGAAFLGSMNAGFADSKMPTKPLPGMERYLLVASDGLYVVEANGKPSWFYTTGKHTQQTFEDFVQDGAPLPNGNFLVGAHGYLREVDRNKKT